MSVARAYIIEGVRVAAIMSTGDVLAQTLVEKKELTQLDLKRTIQFGSIGLFVIGPALKSWFAYLDKLVSPKQPRIQRGFKKMLIDQAVMAPSANFTIMCLSGILNGDSKEDLKFKIKNIFPVILMNNYKLWPAAQMFNFTVVPLNYQVVFNQIVAIFWNCYLSSKVN